MNPADPSTPPALDVRTMEQHRAAILSLAPVPKTETIPVDVNALSRILAADQQVINAIPPFDNSAMDGFLLHRADLDSTGSATLDVVGDVAAGDAPLTPPAGAAVRIMTGAPVDTSTADLVIVPVEYTNIPAGPQPLPAEVHVENFDAAKLHIRRKGESLKAGTLCAHTGQGIDIGLLSTLISAGIAEVEVYAAPRVAVISTGKELRPTGEALAPGKIPDSNSPMVAGLVRTWGPAHTTIAQCDDDPEKLRALFEQLAANHDVIITTGGVAVGVYDVVREVLLTYTNDSWFGRVKHKPGSHQGASCWTNDAGRRVPVVSLPGNPVAAFISFVLYVQPLLDRIAGKPVLAPSATGSPATTSPATVEGKLCGELPKVADRDIFLPAVVDFTATPTTVTPFNGRHVGSHMISALVGVNSVLHLVSGGRKYREGDMVEAILLPTSNHI